VFIVVPLGLVDSEAEARAPARPLLAQITEANAVRAARPRMELAMGFASFDAG